MTNSREAELKEAEDAGYALLGRAFAKAVQEENAPEGIRQSARTLDDWMFRNALRKDEARVIHHLTGFKFRAHRPKAGLRFPPADG